MRERKLEAEIRRALSIASILWALAAPASAQKLYDEPYGGGYRPPLNRNYPGVPQYHKFFRPPLGGRIEDWQRAPFREPGRGPYPNHCYDPEQGYICGGRRA